MKKYLFSLACASLPAAPALANQLYADINPDAFFIQGDATHATNGIIYSGQLLLTTDEGEVLALALRTEGQVGNNASLSGGVGGKVYALNNDSNTTTALSLGGRLQYTIPEFEDLSVSTELYYAPSITMTDEADSLIDFTLRVEYALFENAAVYGGARHIEMETESGYEHEFNSGLNAGIRIEF